MGKPTPSYRVAIEEEIHNWREFRNALPSETERQAFDVLMDYCRSQPVAGSCVCNPVLFEPMVMSILLAQEKRIKTLQRKIDAMLIATLPKNNANAGSQN